jgi:predicted HicB family RNase H-like nuclease
MADDKPRRIRTALRIDRTLLRLAKACARRDGRSLNQWLTHAVRQAVAAAPTRLPEAPEPPPAVG